MAQRRMRAAWAAVTLTMLATMVFLGVSTPTPAHAQGLTAQTAKVTETASSAATAEGGCAYRYVVQRGDTLSGLSVYWRVIAATNNIGNPNRIYVGQTLCLTAREAQGFRRVLGMGAGSASNMTSVHVTVTTKPLSTGNTSGTATGGQPCAGQAIQWPANFSLWTVPAGCFGRIFYPNPANYVSRSGFGWCNWWPEVLNPRDTNLLSRPKTSVARPGEVVWFNGGVYGAGSDGHWAQVVGIHNGWMLITEMNFTWRGGGWQKVDYRFVPLGGGESFIVP